MTLLLNNLKPVDPLTVLEHYEQEGLSTALLRQCNSIEFRWINGAGKGYILLTSDQTVPTGVTTLTISTTTTNMTIDVIVTDVVELDIPSHTRIKLRVACLAEKKHQWESVSTPRNYNVIDRRTVSGTSGGIVAPDSTPLTLQEILDDITGTTVTYNGPVVTPYDVFVDHLNVVEALDYLCSVYGLLWTYQGSTFYFYEGISSDPSFTLINDIREPSRVFSQIDTYFPVLECCVQVPTKFRSTQWSSGNGKNISLYCPFFPAIVTPTGTTTNGTALASYASSMRTYLQKVAAMEGRYIVREYHKNESLTAQPYVFSILYSDYGAGPRTIYRSDEYPYVKPPCTIIKDNQAKNWVGVLYESYRGSVTGFWVVPSFGIDGKPPDGDQYVINLYKWNNGIVGAMVRVEWDCINHRWIALQQEYVCPTGPNPPDPTPPPGPESYPNDFDIPPWILP